MKIADFDAEENKYMAKSKDANATHNGVKQTKKYHLLNGVQQVLKLV